MGIAKQDADNFTKSLLAFIPGIGMHKIDDYLIPLPASTGSGSVLAEKEQETLLPYRYVLPFSLAADSVLPISAQ